jgi:hypothetical protein
MIVVDVAEDAPDDERSQGNGFPEQDMSQAKMLLLASLFSAPAVAEEIYRWQDAAGRWHFESAQSAPPKAVVAAPVTPISVVKTKKVVLPPSPEPRRTSDGQRATKGADMPSELERKREHCERWRERLYRSRLGLRDHEGQLAYERECILKMRW